MSIMLVRSFGGQPIEVTETSPTQPAGGVRRELEMSICIIYRCKFSLPFIVKFTPNPSEERDQTLPGATGYIVQNHLANECQEGRPRLKQVTKSIASLEKICCLLGVKARTASENLCAWDHNPTVVFGGGVFISKPELADPQKNSDMTEIYSRIHFGYSNGLVSTHHFKTQCSSMKQPLQNLSTPLQFKWISINTGLCLFSKFMLATSPGQCSTIQHADDLVIPPLPLGNKPTMYELEIVTRLSSAVADTVSLIGDCHRGRDTGLSINIDIPNFQYYWLACELFKLNLVCQVLDCGD